jgi:hypothetical protein
MDASIDVSGIVEFISACVGGCVDGDNGLCEASGVKIDIAGMRYFDVSHLFFLGRRNFMESRLNEINKL